MRTPRWQIEERVLGEWENVSSERLQDNSWIPLTFATREEALTELAFDLGVRQQQCMDFNPNDFRVKQVEV